MKRLKCKLAVAKGITVIYFREVFESSINELRFKLH